mmetsp:Transcript_46090/g.96790  ORF Transcript_46090/g.96790 Transcript_46090/m.96790 type:complete len:314 (-) Transcript_46090:2340-3281(-)
MAAIVAIIIGFLTLRSSYYCNGFSPAVRVRHLKQHPSTRPSSSYHSFSSSSDASDHANDSNPAFDVILSSGFLCFSRHAGFAAALEDLNLLSRVGRYVGTSSGALAASMLAAGLSADRVATELSAKRPILQVRPSSRFWRGPLSTKSLQKRLKTILPETFEELPTPLAVGVYDVKTREARLVSSGPLVPAVAASCAVPSIFAPVRLGEDQRLHADGGAIDRTFVRGWRDWEMADGAAGGGRRALVHLISSQEDGVYSERDGIPGDGDREDLIDIVHSPRTEGGLFSLGDFEGERRNTQTVVTELLRRRLVLEQ